MKYFSILAYKIRKIFYLIIEALQSVLLAPSLRTGGYFNEPLFTEDGLSASAMRTKGLSYKKTLETINKKGLFILGNSQSGDSNIHQIMGASNDTLMLNEIDLYEKYNTDKCSNIINTYVAGLENQLGETKFTPKPNFPEMNALVVLERASRKYNYCGEKIRISHLSDTQKFFDFHSQYFPESAYILTSRNPVDSISSLKNISPGLSINDCILSWLKSFDLNLRVFTYFKNSNLIFFEVSDRGVLEKITDRLGIATNYLDMEHPSADVMAESNFPEILVPYKILIQNCNEIYSTVKEQFSNTTYLDDKGIKGIQSKRRYLHDLMDVLQHCDLSAELSNLISEALIDEEVLLHLTGISKEIIESNKIRPGYNYEEVENKLRQKFSNYQQLMNQIAENKQLNIWLLDKYVQILYRGYDNSHEKYFYDKLLSLDKKHNRANKYYIHNPETNRLIKEVINYHKLEDYPKASEILEKVFKLTSEHPRANYLLGLNNHMLKNHKLALKYFNKAEALGYPPFRIYFHLGHLYKSMRNMDKARDNMEKARELKPDHQGVLKFLKNNK